MNNDAQITIADFSVHDQVFVVDMTSGDWVPQRPSSISMVPRGFGTVIGHQLGAIFAWNKGLYLFANSKFLICSRGEIKLEVDEVSDGNKRSVRISDQNGVIWSSEYKNPSERLKEIDPTFDELDNEIGDFWLWVSRALKDPDWRSNVIEVWTGPKGVNI